MKILKVAGGIIVLLIILLSVAMYYVIQNLDSLIKKGIETKGSQVLQTEVTVDTVKFKLREGSGELAGFEIKNPAPFTADTAFEFDRIFLQIDTASLSQSVKVIKEITIDDIEVTAEQKELTTNLQTLLKNIQNSSPPTTETSTEKGGSDLRLMVEKIHFTGGKVHLVTEKKGSYELTLPAFDLSNIGDKQNGIPPESLAVKILEPLLKKAESAAKDKLKQEASDELEEKLKQKVDESLDDKSKQKLDKLKGLLKKS